MRPPVRVARRRSLDKAHRSTDTLGTPKGGVKAALAQCSKCLGTCSAVIGARGRVHLGMASVWDDARSRHVHRDCGGIFRAYAIEGVDG